MHIISISFEDEISFHENLQQIFQQGRVWFSNNHAELVDNFHDDFHVSSFAFFFEPLQPWRFTGLTFNLNKSVHRRESFAIWATA